MQMTESELLLVDVTAPMIEAGIEAWDSFDREDPISWKLAAAYEAMYLVKPLVDRLRLR